MNSHPGLRHFEKGISTVSQWTGTEHKEMQKVSLGIVVGALTSHAFAVAKALLNFIYLSQLQLHTSKTLDALGLCLRTFHENKEVFVELEIRKDFNVPKIHSLMHYVTCIRALGSADGYNSESPERLHIDFAKDAYRASNKRDYMEQMALWLQRHEAVWQRESYLIWIENRFGMVVAEKNEEDESDDEEVDHDVGDVQCGCNMTTTTNNSCLNYLVTKRPPFQNITVDKFIHNFGAIDFISALSIFLQHTFPGTTILPSIHDRFDAYKKLVEIGRAHV